MTTFYVRAFAHLGLFISLLMTASVSHGDHLDVLTGLNCPTEGALRCNDIAVYRTHKGATFLREYHGSDLDGLNYFTDRLENGNSIIFVFDQQMAQVSAGAKTMQPNNGMRLVGLSANETRSSDYDVMKDGKPWAKVKKTCVEGSDLKKVAAGRYPANRVTCESAYYYESGGMDTRFDTYWLYVPARQIIAWESKLQGREEGWGAELIALLPVSR